MGKDKDTCAVCINGETCNKDSDRIHCNLYDRSFDKDACCEQFEKDLEKK